MDSGPDHHAAVPGEGDSHTARHRQRRAELSQPVDGPPQIRPRGRLARHRDVRLPHHHLLLLHRHRLDSLRRLCAQGARAFMCLFIECTCSNNSGVNTDPVVGKHKKST